MSVGLKTLPVAVDRRRWRSSRGVAMFSAMSACLVAVLALTARVAAQPCDWSPLGEGLDSGILAMTPFDDGSGPALYVGGSFQAAGGRLAHSIARWDGEAWSSVGPGFRDGLVYSLAVFDDGRGS